MSEYESPRALEHIAETYTAKKNQVRAEWLHDMLPNAPETEKIFEYLKGSISDVRLFWKKYDAILAGQSVMIFRQELEYQLQEMIAEHYGKKSYVRDIGDAWSDETEWNSGDMIDAESTLLRASVERHEVVLANEIGRIRKTALAYTAANFPRMLSEIVRSIVMKHVVSSFQHLGHPLPDQLIVPADQREEQRLGASPLAIKIMDYLAESKKDEIQKLVEGGMHPRMARRKVLTAMKEALPPRDPKLEEEWQQTADRRFVALEAELPAFLQDFDALVDAIINVRELERITT